MGIGGQIVDALAREHRYKPLQGSALLIGRQTVYYTAPDIVATLRAHGVEPAIPQDQIEIDHSTIDRLPEFQDSTLISDVSLMRLFGLHPVKALDHSSYENADIVHDLRFPLPRNLEGSADILVDGSTLDNIFTPAMVLQNFTKLLRPGGRMFLANVFSSFESAYIVVPPMWYVDYFVMNGFADCRVYVLVFLESRGNAFVVDLNDVYRLKRDMGFFPIAQSACTIVFAEKGSSTTHDKLPIQQHYRSQEDWQIYQKNLAAMLQSKRPHLACSTADPFVPNIQRGHRFINRKFAVDDNALSRAAFGRLSRWRQLRSIAGRVKRAFIG